MDTFLQDCRDDPCDGQYHTPMTGPSQAAMQVRTCPFCGLSTESPHETQASCIAALQAEVSRMRELLDHLKPAGAPPAPPADPDKRT